MDKRHKEEVTFSIVIPTCERLEQVKTLLSSITKSVDFVSDECNCEIIVSDDGRNESTKFYLKNQASDVLWVQGPSKGPGANRNNGVNYSKGKWIIFIDDDCYVEKDFIKQYHKFTSTVSNSVLEGKIVCPDKSNSIFKRQPENAQGGVLASGNFAIRKDLFLEVDGFDEDLLIMEDMEFAYRLKRLGHDFVFCENAVAFHPSQPKSLSYYWTWIFHFKW
ncbi:uncharacterized protein METZ01_LOCUS426350, partial [marine metagenome]